MVMTLKEKFKDIVSDSITYKQQYDSFEQIADDYAIEFAEWCNTLISRIGMLEYKRKYSNKPTKELLEIFKKEKGL